MAYQRGENARPSRWAGRPIELPLAAQVVLGDLFSGESKLGDFNITSVAIAFTGDLRDFNSVAWNLDCGAMLLREALSGKKSA